MPLSLRVKLFLGKVTDWDKDVIKIALFVVAIFVAGFMYDGLVRPMIFPESGGYAEGEGITITADELLEEIRKQRRPSPGLSP